MVKNLALAVVLWFSPAVLVSGGCACREAADRGHRLLDRQGLPLSKLFAMAGAVPGSAAAVPVTVALLPTGLFPGLRYRSSPDHDISMPILFAPLELGGGLGAYLLGTPFRPLDRLFWPMKEFPPAPRPEAAGVEARPAAESPAGISGSSA
jgi:hypothetical protein